MGSVHFLSGQRKDPIKVQTETVHYTLIDTVEQILHVDSTGLQRLKHILTPHVKDTVNLDDSVPFSKLCAALLDTELIKIGEYKFLREMLKQVDQGVIADRFEDAEEEIQDILYAEGKSW